MTRRDALKAPRIEPPLRPAVAAADDQHVRAGDVRRGDVEMNPTAQPERESVQS